MTALVVLGVLGLTALFLAGLLTYLYRWRVRKKLFPQLPRLWKRDRSRFFISSVLFIVSLLTFMVVSLVTGPSLPEPPKKMTAKKEQGPSFDGAPPPPMPRPTTAPKAKTLPNSAQPSPQTAMRAPTTPVGQTGPKTQPQQTVPFTATEQQQSTVQAKPSGPAPVKEQPEQLSGRNLPAVQSNQSEQVQPKVETPVDKSSADKTVIAPSETAEPQTQPTKEEGQPKVAKKNTPPKAKDSNTASVKQAAKPSEIKVPSKARPEGKAFAVCVASFRDRKSAQRQIMRLANKGLKGKIIKAELKEKGLWYRVCLGEFASSRQAMAKAKAWRDNDLVKTPFVVRLR